MKQTFCLGGSAPKPPGFTAFAPRYIVFVLLLEGRRLPPRTSRPLSRRSGRIPALPYPPLSSTILSTDNPRL